MLRQMLVWLVSPHRLIRNSRLSLIIQQKVEINMIKVKKQINMTGLVMSGGRECLQTEFLSQADPVSSGCQAEGNQGYQLNKGACKQTVKNSRTSKLCHE